MKELKKLKKLLSQKEEAIKRIKRLYPHLKILSDDMLLKYLGLLNYEMLIDFSRELEACDVAHSKKLDINKKISCYCCDSEGMPKILYRYKMDAERAKRFIANREMIELKIYLCPLSKGWHLARV